MSSVGLLDIQPSELKFTIELKKQSSCSLHLVNKTDHYVAFKVKTTNPKKYCVRPNTGVVTPRSACDVTVTMQAQRDALADVQCKDRFLIQSVLASHGATAKDISAETFNKEDGKVVEECKMGVVYVPPLQPPSPVPEEAEEASSPRASYQSDNRNSGPYLYDAVSRASDESNKKNPEVLNMISTLTTEKKSAIQLNQKLQQELELLRKEHSGGHQGFSLLFVALVGILGFLVGYLVKT